MKLLCDITADLLQGKLCTNGQIKEIVQDRIRAISNVNTFAASSVVLMHRLCADLLVPMDQTCDDQYYGSNPPPREAGAPKKPSHADQQTRRENGRNVEMLYPLGRHDGVQITLGSNRAEEMHAESHPEQVDQQRETEDCNYFSDFTDDTDNEIEEQLDFD